MLSARVEPEALREGPDSFLRTPTAGVRVRKGAKAARRRRLLAAFSRSGLGGSLLQPGLPSEHGRPTLASHRNPKRKRGHTLLRIAPNPSLTLRVTILNILQGFRAEAALSDQPRKSFLPHHSLPSSSLVTQGLPSSVWRLGDALRSGASRKAVPKLELGNEKYNGHAPAPFRLQVVFRRASSPRGSPP